MKLYGAFAFEFKVLERKRETSWPRDVFVRSGERRLGMGRAIGVGVWEGIFRDLRFRGSEGEIVSYVRLK
jgi:hypothetical protein